MFFKKKKILFYLIALFLLCFFLILSFGYPRDERVYKDFTWSEQTTDHKKYILSTNWTHSFSNTHKHFTRVFTKLAKDFPQLLRRAISKKNDPQLLFASIGSYPERLEAYHGYLLDSKNDFILDLHESKPKRITLKSFAVQEKTELALFCGEKKIFTKKILPVLPPVNTDSLWYKVLTKYLDPLAPWLLNRWTNNSITLKNCQEKKLRIKCLSSKNGACFLAKPQLWQEKKQASKKSILILMDTYSANMLNKKFAPFLNKLSKKSQTFTQAISPGNMTSIATNSILACQAPFKLKEIAYSYGMSEEKQRDYYKNHPASFPKLLQNAGVLTAMIGNISIISEVKNIGINHGFHELIAIERSDYDTPLITEEALTWLDRNIQNDFFLYIHYHNPHAPYRAPLKDLKKTFLGMQNLTSYVQIMHWLYSAEIHYLDRYLKILFDKIKQNPNLKGTQIFISADHGDQNTVREFTANDAAFSFSGTYFDHGATLYQEEIHVPLISLKLGEEKEKTIEKLTSTLGLGPSFLKFHGLKTPDYCQEKAYFTKQDKPAKQQTAKIILSQGLTRKAIIYKDRYKYIRSYKPIKKKYFSSNGYRIKNSTFFAPEELYDLKADPFEKENLIRENLKLKKEARSLWRKAYQIKTGYQLSIKAKKGSQIKINWPSLGPDILKEKINEDNEPLHIKLDENKRLHQVSVWINEKKIKIHYTSLNLPLQKTPPLELPIEGKKALESLNSLDEYVLIWNSELNDQHVENIHIAHNPDFEKVLAEWGYLNSIN